MRVSPAKQEPGKPPKQDGVPAALLYNAADTLYCIWAPQVYASPGQMPDNGAGAACKSS